MKTVHRVQRTSFRFFSFGLVLFLFNLPAYCQSTTQVVTLDSCLYYGNRNFPLLKQRLLLEASTKQNLENLDRMLWPQVSVQGQATLQSEVTGIPISLPNVEIPTLSKDQYRLYTEVNQSITDIFTMPDARQANRQLLKIEEQKLEIEIFKWEERIVDLYFQIASLQAQREQVFILRNDVEAGLKKLQSGVDNGIVLSTSLDQLLAEKVKIEQKDIEIIHGIQALISVLETYTGLAFQKNAKWTLPENIVTLENKIRPEITLLDEQQKMTEAQWQVTQNKQLPRLGAFLQWGVGRPGLNMLSNDLDTYWIGGLRLQWNIANFYTLKGEKKLLDLQREMLGVQKQNFNLLMDAADKQLAEESLRYMQLIEKDHELLTLREKIQEGASAQLENGTITAQDYLNFVNQTDLARQNLASRQIQYMKMKYQHFYLKGNRFSANN